MPRLSISVVIPTFDRPDYLIETVRSVLIQTSPAQEILIIDNGSVPIDPTKLPDSELTQIFRALPRFGVSQARNLGAILARYDMICFLDDDDSWDHRYLESVRKTWAESGAEVILGRLRDLKTMLPLQGKQADFKGENDLISQILRRNPGAGGSNTCVMRNRFLSSPGYDPSITTNQDKALVLDLLLAGASAKRAENGWVNVRNDGEGPRQTELHKRAKGKWRFLTKYWKIMSWHQRALNILVWLMIFFRRVLGSA